MNQTAVLIIGAGPTGLMMACQLARFNVPFRIIDKTEDHTTQSRALVIQARSLEIFDQMGIAGKAIRHGKIAKAIGAFFNGKKALRVVVNDMGGGLTKFPFFLMLEQSQTEKILLEFLHEHGYQVERNAELKSLTQNNDEVTSVIKLPNGQEELVNTTFVVGADGAHSIVRELLDIPFGGKTYQESLFVMDCKADVDIPHDEMYLMFSGEALGGFFPLTNGRWRILGNIPKELEGKKQITFEDIEKNFAQRTRMRVKLYDPQWISAYHAHHRYASTFRKGNCFLTGDAAHIHSPVGAQGMNTGLQDAYNLGWKIALVLKKSKNELLDTYTEERITIARNLVRSTDKVFSVATSSNFIIKTIRLYVIPIVLKIGAPVFQGIKFIQRSAFTRVSEIGIHYRKSTLSRNASFGKFPPAAPKPGDRLPFINYTDTDGREVNIQDKMRGKLFCLFVFADNPTKEMLAAGGNFNDLISIETIPMTSQNRTLYKTFGIKNNGFYLIRPDSYIAFRNQSLRLEKLEIYFKANLNARQTNYRSN